MARISKADHPRILQMIDEEQCKVAEVAAAYSCTPANIYALLGKLRHAARVARAGAAGAEAATPTLFEKASGPRAAGPEKPAEADHPVAAVVRPAPEPPKAPVQPAAPAVQAAPPRTATVTDLPRGQARGVGASRAKPGFGLAMRTAEGDEAMTPFRSLEDLLSAIKPILRAAARSPEPVWFAVQPIDLAMLDSDAA